MARELGLYLIAIFAFSSLTVAVASADTLPQDFLVGPLTAAVLLFVQPLLLWAVARGTEPGWRI